jgi:CRISPR-associated protein Csx3
VEFLAQAWNDQIVKDAAARLDEMIYYGELEGGDLIFVNGPVPMPLAMMLAHKLAHLYQTVACFDPKISKYVVVIAQCDKYAVGDLID